MWNLVRFQIQTVVATLLNDLAAIKAVPHPDCIWTKIKDVSQSQPLSSIAKLRRLVCATMRISL